MSYTMSQVRFLAAALLAASTAACSGCEDDLVPIVGEDSGARLDAGIMLDAGQTETDAGVPPAPVRVLTFDGTSPVTVYYRIARDLRFLLKDGDGAPVANEQIQFSLTGTPGTISTMTAVTDAQGAAVVRFTAGAAQAQGAITANAEYANPVTVLINVQEDPSAGLIVDVRSNTRIRTASADAFVYIGTQAQVPTCAALRVASPLPTATLSANFATVPNSRTYTNQTSGQRVTVFALGKNANGAIIAQGCTEGVTLVGATNTRVIVTLAQNPTDFDGNYDVLMQFDLGTALPSPYDTTVNLVTDILSDPAGWAVYQTLAAIDDQSGFTSFLQCTVPVCGNNTARATFRQVTANPNVFNVWREARTLVRNFLVSLLGNGFITVETVGGDIDQLIRRFEVGAEFALTTTTSASRVSIEESWKAIVFTWSLSCPQGDTGCARRPIELSGANAHLAPAAAVYGGTITHAPTTTPAPGQTERFRIEPDEHPINIRYGAIIILALNQIVFPNLPGNIAGNNLTQVVQNIVNCPNVGTSVSNATGGLLSANFVEGLCTAAVTAAATYVENQILALDSQNNPGLIGRPEDGLTGGGEFFLIDADHDLRPELVRNLTMYAQWTTPGNPNQSQDLTSPITGEGRRAAENCTVNSDCPTGMTCSPIAHYLKVRALELDCRYVVGNTAGGVGCAQNSDCASGLCFDPGSGVRICYEACEGASTCSIGTCTADAANVSLNGVLAGLGSASVDACVP